jgi:phage-related protein
VDWEIPYYSEALQEEIADFPAGIQARYIHLTDRMLIYGANLGMPHTKAMKNGLFELRMKEVKANANT